MAPEAFLAKRVRVVGAPWRRTTNPSRTISRIALLTVGRHTPNLRARAHSLGNTVVSSYLPSSTSLRSVSKISL